MAFMGFIFFYSADSEDSFLHNEEIRVLDKEIELKDSEGNSIIADLPVKVPSEKTYTIDFVPSDRPTESSLYLAILSMYVSYELSCENEILYQHLPEEGMGINSGGSSIRLIRIPNECKGKTMKVKFFSLVEPSPLGFSGMQIPKLYLGARAALLNKFYRSNVFEILSSVSLLVISILLMIFGIVLYVLKHKGYAYLILISMAGFLLTPYISARAYTLHVILERDYYMYFVDYTMLLLVPVPLLLILVNEFKHMGIEGSRVGIIKALIISLCSNALIQSILTAFGILEFVQVQVVTNIIVPGSFVASLIVLLSIDGKKYRKKRVLLMSISPVVVVTTFSFVIYIFHYSWGFTPAVVFGSFLFLLVHFVNAVGSYTNDYKLNLKSEFYRELAYSDTLTGLGNRRAFDRDILNMRARDKFLLIVIDINSLKAINDRYGHSTGDKLITSMGTVANYFCGLYYRASSYRVGGDEFYIIVPNPDKRAEELVEDLRNLGAEFRRENPDIPLSFALGYEEVDLAEGDDISFSIELADRKMYEDKNKSELRKSLKNDALRGGNV